MPTPVASNFSYDQFVTFAATAADDKTILDSQSINGSGPAIVAKTKGDFVGNIGRSKDAKAANDSIRNNFRKTIVDMFGVGSADKLPDPIKKAMKLNDYDKGKPLTARRIQAVSTAVEQYRNDLMKSLLGSPGMTFSPTRLTHKRIDTAIAACQGDMDAYDLVKSNAFEILYGTDRPGDASPLPENIVKTKIERIVNNVRALREGVGNDKQLFNTLKPLLLVDADLSPQLVRSMVDSVNRLDKTQDLGFLRRLTAKASARDIHEVAFNLNELLYSGIDRTVPRSDAPAPGHKQLSAEDHDLFLVRIIFAKALPKGTSLSDLKTALETGPATKLMRFYDDIRNSGTYQRNREIPPLCLERLKMFIDKCCDGPLTDEQPIKPFGEEGSVTAHDIGFETNAEVYDLGRFNDAV